MDESLSVVQPVHAENYSRVTGDDPWRRVRQLNKPLERDSDGQRPYPDCAPTVLDLQAYTFETDCTSGTGNAKPELLTSKLLRSTRQPSLLWQQSMKFKQ